MFKTVGQDLNMFKCGNLWTPSLVVSHREPMDRALCVIARSTSVALRLAAGRGDRRLFLSYAVEVPVAAEFAELTWWATDAYAARLHVAGLAPAFAAPPWNWLSSIDPALTGRTVVSTTVDRLPTGRLFVKPALLKLLDVPAKVWEADDFTRAAVAAGATGDLQVQYCHKVLRLDDEHRFVVCGGEVLTGSAYRVGGRAWSAGLTSRRTPQAWEFTRRVVRDLGGDCPDVCSLDVAWDVDGERWVVVEANPLWASGPYDCAPAPFVEAVAHANVAGTGRWAWVPETTQLERARREQPVVAVPQQGATGYAEFSA